MVNLSLIPIFAFILILLPIAIISFFKSIRWALMLLCLILVAGALSFLITFFLYKPLLLGLFESILTWRLGEDMALEQMEKLSKGIIMGIFSTFIILPLSLIIFLIFNLMKKWLNKPLGPKVTVISKNEKSIVRKSLKFQKMGSGVISISTGLILASTIASSTSIILTPAYKNEFFNKMIKPFSFPLNYGNGYDKNWQRLYAFLDSANENKVGLKGLRELINFNSFKGDLTPEEKKSLREALAKIDTPELNSYFSKIDDSSDLTDIGIRVLLGKFVYGLDHKIMASDQSETTEEADFDKFLSDFDSWAKSDINKNNLFLKNKIGVEKAIRSLLNQNHDYKDTHYYKNELAIKDLIKSTEALLVDSNKEYDKLVLEKQNKEQNYESEFRKMQSVANNLQNKINDFISLWQKIGKGHTDYVDNKYHSIPSSITTFANKNYVTKDLHSDSSIVPPKYDEKSGKPEPSKKKSAPRGKSLRSSRITADGKLTIVSNTLIKQYIKAYDDLKTNPASTKIDGVGGTPEDIFYQTKQNYLKAQDDSDGKLNELQNYKSYKNSKNQEIDSAEKAQNDAINQRDALQEERDNLLKSISRDKTSLDKAEQELQRAKENLKKAQKQKDAKKENLKKAQNNIDRLESQCETLKSKNKNDNSRLNELGKKDSSSGLIKDQINCINELENKLANLKEELKDINQQIEKANTEYNTLKKETEKKENDFLQAKDEYDRLSGILNNKKSIFENEQSKLENNLQDINHDIEEIKNYVDDNNIKSRWDVLLQNSINIWEIKGNADSFSPEIQDLPTIDQSKTTDPSYQPPEYQEIAYTNKSQGGASIVYLENKITYLKELLVLAGNIKAFMKKTYNDRLESITSSITKILT